MREHFISVDIETSGPIPGAYSMLTIGACSVENHAATFEVRLKPLNANAVPKALEVTGLSLSELEESGLPPAVAMDRFERWLREIVGARRTPVFVGLNAPFDWSFVNYYFHLYLGQNPFGIAALDIKALYMGRARCEWTAATSDRMAKRLHPSRRGTHDALDDALYQAELFRLILDLPS